MKNQLLSNIIMIGVSALLGNTPVIAQNIHTATIPFSFEAGGTEYPSGTYEIQKMGSHPIIRLANVETRRSNMIAAPVPAGSSKTTDPKLVFRTTGDQYRLTEIWLQDQPGMMTYKSSKADREQASVKVAIK